MHANRFIKLCLDNNFLWIINSQKSEKEGKNYEDPPPPLLHPTPHFPLGKLASVTIMTLMGTLMNQGIQTLGSGCTCIAFNVHGVIYGRLTLFCFKMSKLSAEIVSLGTLLQCQYKKEWEFVVIGSSTYSLEMNTICIWNFEIWPVGCSGIRK